ncbi:MAG TPA: hypothetical protein VHM00_11195 [Caldimonas sp.]|jgi:hypothetical protein|nr:hypothetical protein [Caldimonas sp.]HEX2541633.1 hypothetical protein [Caldimonas sp.]
MVKRVHVGDTMSLPSGRVCKVTAVADPRRPWAAVHIGSGWYVHRPRIGPGVEHYFAGQLTPLQLDELDANAAAMILNTVRD